MYDILYIVYCIHKLYRGWTPALFSVDFACLPPFQGPVCPRYKVVVVVVVVLVIVVIRGSRSRGRGGSRGPGGGRSRSCSTSACII